MYTNICIQCKNLAIVSCSCDNSLRFCYDCYLFVHKKTNKNHDPISLFKTRKEVTPRIRFSEDIQRKYFKFAKNSSEIQKQLQSNFNLYLQGHTSCVIALTLTNDNKYVVSASSDYTVRIWNLLQKTQENILLGHLDEVTAVVMTSDNKSIISGSRDKTIRIWNFLEKTQESVLEGHTCSVLTVAVTSDNKYIISGAWDNTIRIWNYLLKTQETVLRGHSSYISSVAVTSDNKCIISGSRDNKNLKSFRENTRKCFARTHGFCSKCSSFKR